MNALTAPKLTLPPEEAESTARLTRQLETYLRNDTEILFD
jgi:hypothetical protein